jgi:hypothetical protein
VAGGDGGIQSFGVVVLELARFAPDDQAGQMRERQSRKILYLTPASR